MCWRKLKKSVAKRDVPERGVIVVREREIEGRVGEMTDFYSARSNCIARLLLRFSIGTSHGGYLVERRELHLVESDLPSDTEWRLRFSVLIDGRGGAPFEPFCVSLSLSPTVFVCQT